MHPLSVPPFIAVLSSLIGGIVYLWAGWRILSPGVRSLWRDSGRYERVLLMILLIAAGLSALPAATGNLTPVPDATEATIGAYEWIQHGVYGFQLSHVPHAPRYPLGFSLFVIAPWMGIWSLIHGGPLPIDALKIPILPLAIHGVWALLAAAAIGRRLGTPISGILAAALLWCVPGLIPATGTVLTHVPIVALTLTIMLYGISPSETQLPATKIAACILLVCGSLIRPLCILWAIPLMVLALRKPGTRWRSVLLMGGAVFVSLFLHCAYNWIVFDDFLRNGYNYWCSIPYDSFSLTFSRRYVWQNVQELWRSGISIFAGACLAAVFYEIRARRDTLPPQLGSIVLIFTLGILPIGAIHLFYFYPWSIFFIPLTGCLGVVAGGMCSPSSLLNGTRPILREVTGLLVGCALILSIGTASTRLAKDSGRYQAAQAIAEHVQERDLIISAIDPVYLAPFLSSTITIIPISRRVEYASKYVAPHRINFNGLDGVQVTYPRDMRLLLQGAHDVVPFVALDENDKLSLDAAEYARIVIDESFMTKEERTSLRSALELDGAAPWRISGSKGHIYTAVR